MAVKSASMAYLNVPEMTFRKADYFLDSMQMDGGAKYGYAQQPMRHKRNVRLPFFDLGVRATSPIGLLCRMYLGWKHERQAWAKALSC